MSGAYDHLKGIIPALITPYTIEGNINELVTRKLVRHHIDKGVNGFYLSGSTGEGFLQTIEERKQFLEIVIDESQGAVPVIAHVGAMDTQTCVELTIHAAATGAAAVSAVPPFYYKHRPEQIRQHYMDIVNAADIPLIIYHIPHLTGVSAALDFYKELSEVDGIIGIKFTSIDTYELQQLVDTCGDEFLVYQGGDESCLSGLVMGACGAIGSTYNIMPEKFIQMFQHVQAGNLKEAQAIQFEVNVLIRQLLQYDFIAFEREVLRLQGFDVGNPRKPLQQLTDAQRLEIQHIAREFAFLGIA